MACGGRLKLSDFWLNHDDAGLFFKSQWPIHRCIYLAWRVFLALYLLGWLVADLATRAHFGTFFIYFTNWTFTVLTVYAVLSCGGSIYFTFRRGHHGHTDILENYSTKSQNVATELNGRGSSFPPQPVDHKHTVRPRLPHYLKLAWLLFNICLAVDPLITVVYWSFLTPDTPQPPIHWAIDAHVHALNTVFIYADLFLSATPVRLVHFFYGIAYGTVYMSFTLIYYWAGGLGLDGSTAIYPKILDWAMPGRTVLALSLTVLAIVLSHLLGYGAYRLRVFMHKRCFGNNEEETRILTLSEETGAENS